MPKKTYTPPPLIETGSSAVKGYGYDAANQVLWLQFTKSGPAYPSFGVPQALYDRMVKTHKDGGSLGTFNADHIRGKFSSTPPVEQD